MVVVVPSLAICQERNPPQIGRPVARDVRAVAPHVTGRIHQPSGVQDEHRANEPAPDQPAHPAGQVEPKEKQKRKNEVPPLEPHMNRDLAKVRTPFLVILERVLRFIIDFHPPGHVRPQEAPKRRVRVVFLVRMRMVLAVIGNPADRAALGGTGPDDRQNVLKPARAKRKTAVRKQAVIGKANSNAPGQPVQQNANGKPTPGEERGHKGKKSKSVQGPDPDQGDPSQPCRRRLRRGRCRHNQPLFVYIAEDGFVLVGGANRRGRDIAMSTRTWSP
jgi:hypothetical protein